MRAKIHQPAPAYVQQPPPPGNPGDPGNFVSSGNPGNPCNPAQDFGPLLCCALDAEGKQLECPGIARGIMTPTMP